MLNNIHGPKRGKYEETGENCIMRSFIVCTHNQIFKSRLIIWLEHMASVEK